MGASAYLVNFALTIVLIVGAYQFYFYPQRRPVRPAMQFAATIDNRIPFRPGWVWIYSGLYYPVIILLIFTIDSFERFNYTAFNFLTLLFAQLICFFVMPVRTPPEWRNYDHEASLSTRFLRVVHGFDAPTNCFPSMHVSVATLTALHLANNLQPSLGGWELLCYAFPVLIGLSALFTKQHYLIDLPTGAVLGYSCYELWSMFG